MLPWLMYEKNRKSPPAFCAVP